MVDNGEEFLSNEYICDKEKEVIERLEESAVPHKVPNQYIVKYLMKTLELSDKIAVQGNLDIIKKNEINRSYKELEELREKAGIPKSMEENVKRSKKVSKDVSWKKEICLVEEKEKIDILRYLNNEDLIVDKIKFIEEDKVVVGLTVKIGDIDIGDEGEEDPSVFILPEFILNAQGSIEPLEDDLSWDICIEDIKEIIVEDTKYTFMD